MSDHPINSMMETVMTNIKQMVDVNTIVGSPITTPDGTVIIPVSRVNFGFGTGGSDYPNTTGSQIPFGGGGGAGISIVPMAFLTVKDANIKLLTIDNNPSSFDKMLTSLPELIDKLNSFFAKKENSGQQQQEQPPQN